MSYLFAALFSLVLVLVSLSSSVASEAAPRPPQYIALAFDGSKSIDVWKLTREFAKTATENGTPLKFTYFISGVYYVTQGNRAVYHGPKHPAGVSDIGFGEPSNTTLLQRVAETNLAHLQGNEIASHANGHFDGGKWTADEWSLEFALFNQLLFGLFGNNKLPVPEGKPNPFDFTEKDVVGFRAPLLAVSPGLWPTLKANHYRYDTSKVALQNYWPEKSGVDGKAASAGTGPSGQDANSGYWNFPLVEMRIAGTGKATLSMDYNFYVSQSGGKSDPANSGLYEQQMYETYLRYFQNNYNGNRAPVHIGHHFSLWNGGAYWRAMTRFAQTVCGKPEVKCVTYRELADYMDTLDAPTLAAYRKGEFDKVASPIKLGFQLESSKEARLALAAKDGALYASVVGRDAALLEARGLEIHWETGLAQSSGPRLRLDSLADAREVSAVATLDGIEILRSTRSVLPAFDGGDALLSDADREALVLQGDLPAAHDE